MYLTRDYLKADPWDAVIARINEQYGTELQPYTTKLESFVPLGVTSTQVTIIPNQVEDEFNTAPPIERTEYVYDRLDLQTFFRSFGVKDLPGFTLPTNTSDVLAAIGEFNEIVFTLNDFVHVEYNTYNETFTLTANPKSLRFVGKIDFRLINTTRRALSDVSSQFEFPLANTWPLGNPDGAKISAQYVTAGYDFTSEREYLKVLTRASVWPTGRKLAAIVQDITGTPWVCSKDLVDWNLAFDADKGEGRIRVVYNGRVLPRYSPRTDISNVVVLELGIVSNNVAGYLLLHYN